MKFDIREGEVLQIEMRGDLTYFELLSRKRWARIALTTKLVQEFPDKAIEEGVTRCRAMLPNPADVTT